MASSSSSLRLVPGPSTTASTSIDSTSHPIHAGLHDAIRHGQRNMAHQAAVESGSLHPLQPRLEKWDETRDTMKLTLQRNIHGMGAPLRTMMERKVVSYDPHFPALHKSPGNGMGGTTRGGFSQLQLDILNGDDETLNPADFLPTHHAASGGHTDLHAHMERKYGI